VKLAQDVIALIPQSHRPMYLGLQIGLNTNSRNEMRVLDMPVDLCTRPQPTHPVPTPHLEDTLKGLGSSGVIKVINGFSLSV